MPDMWMDVDAALSEVPVNLLPLLDDGDFKTRETAVTYDQAGMDLVWNFVTTAGAQSQTAVTPTTGGIHDWANQGDGMYSIEIPASGGTIDNDTEGFGWFTGYATGVLPWRGPVIGFRSVAHNNALIDGTLVVFITTIADILWRRGLANIRASSDGEAVGTRNPLWMLSKLTNRVYPSGTRIRITEEDDATTYWEQEVTTDSGAEPTTEVNTV